MIEKNNNMGTINISLDVVATIAGGAATECYGVVGMASKKRLKDGIMICYVKKIILKEQLLVMVKLGLFEIYMYCQDMELK